MATTVLDSAATTTNATVPANFAVSAGSNRKLIVCIRYNDGGPDLLTALTYGTQSMTEVMKSETGSLQRYVYELDEAGITAASSTVFAPTYSPATPGSGFRFVSHVISVQDADQDPITLAEFNLTNQDPLAETFTAVDNALGISFADIQHDTGTGSTHAWENSWTEVAEADGNDPDVTASLATKALSAGAETAQCNQADGQNVANGSFIVAVQVEAFIGKVWINDAATKDGGEVLQDYPGAANWADGQIDMQTVIDTTGLSGQLYVGVESATGAIAWRAITTDADGTNATIIVPMGPIR